MNYSGIIFIWSFFIAPDSPLKSLALSRCSGIAQNEFYLTIFDV